MSARCKVCGLPDDSGGWLTDNDTGEHWHMMCLAGELTGPREASMNNVRHIEGGSCCQYVRCTHCNGRIHVQDIDDVLDNPTDTSTIGRLACESCPSHASEWQPAGTYAHLEVS